VFLLQGHGKRNWKIGQMCDSESPLLQHADLRILAEFEETESWVLEPGDMLYLPPRLAHYGVAMNDCMTYSVGFRAPSAAEVLTHFTDFLGQFLPDEDRYTDADVQPVSDPHQIQQDALDRLKSLLAEHMSDERLLLTWFGQYMTEPRYPELVVGPEEVEEEDFLSALEDGAILIRNPSARLAWSEVDDDLLLFASGQSRYLPGKLRELLNQYGFSLKHIINLLDPQSIKRAPTPTVAPGKRKPRELKVYKNPHTGEVIETKGGNHKTLEEWKNKHGSNEVESWLDK